ncbi:hypothetical protein J7J13_03025 [bacterium]|nr:hypothetical protein [bacterium]
MTLKSYLWGMRISAALSVAAWSAVVYNINPEEAGIVGQILFYLSLFLALAGIFILFLTWSRRKISGNERAFAHLGMSFRQGVLLSVLANTLLAFQSFRILTWWDGLLLVAGIFIIELYFLSR